jgi:PAS domain S-box-containing protein
MNSDSPQIRSIPTHELLEGLARLHPFVLVADRAGRIEWMSAKLRSRLNQSGSGPVPRTSLDADRLGELLAHVPEPRQLDALRDDLRTNGRAGRVNLDIETEHGTQISVEASAFAVDFDEPDDSHYVVIARPEEDRARTERHLQATVGLLSQLLDSAPTGVIATDSAGYVTYANRGAVALSGRSLDELLGSPIARFLSTSAGFEDLLANRPDPSDWEGEVLESIGDSGESTWISLSTRHLLAPDGHPDGFIVYLCDITRRREVQHELERKNRELEGYVDTVAHDLRSPLVSLLGFTRLLKHDYQDSLDETAHHFLDRVEQAGRTMDALIHDLLELSRIQEPGELQPLLDPRSVLLQVEAELKLRLEEQGVRLSIPDAPPMMRVDATRLYQIFSNLIGNALTHGFEGKALGCDDPCVSIEVCDQVDYQEVVVSDNGRGISREDQRRIFEVFQTSPGVRRREHSHGIGLAIVKKIAEAYGGRMWVVSEPGQGTHFHIRLPHPASR